MKSFWQTKALVLIFHILIHHNKMVLLKGETNRYVKLLGLCFHLQIFYITFGWMWFPQLVLLTIGLTLTSDYILLLMKVWLIANLRWNFFLVFGSRCFLYNSKEHKNIFYVKEDESFFLGYSLNSKGYLVLNKKTRRTKESYYVTFEDKTSNLIRNL